MNQVTITHKFAIGQEVWCAFGGKPARGTVSWFATSHKKQGEYLVVYHIQFEECETAMTYIEESLFATKEEILSQMKGGTR